MPRIAESGVRQFRKQRRLTPWVLGWLGKVASYSPTGATPRDTNRIVFLLSLRQPLENCRARCSQSLAFENPRCEPSLRIYGFSYLLVNRKLKTRMSNQSLQHNAIAVPSCVSLLFMAWLTLGVRQGRVSIRYPPRIGGRTQGTPPRRLWLVRVSPVFAHPKSRGSREG